MIFIDFLSVDCYGHDESVESCLRCCVRLSMYLDERCLRRTESNSSSSILGIKLPHFTNTSVNKQIFTNITYLALLWVNSFYETLHIKTEHSILSSNCTYLWPFITFLNQYFPDIFFENIFSKHFQPYSFSNGSI